MLRVQKDLTDVEMIDALNDIIDIIIDCYNKPLRQEFVKYSRSAQIGHDIFKTLRQKKIMEIYAQIGYDTQRYLLERDIIRTGGIENG